MSSRPQPRFTRGLRFRLTASYALFFSLVLIGMGQFFRQKLKNSLDVQIHEVLEQEWAAVKGYLKIENNKPLWYYDPVDTDENFIVGRLQRVYMLANAAGIVMESSELYRSIGLDSPAEIRQVMSSVRGTQKAVWRLKTSPAGASYLFREGVVFDERHREPYFVSIGRPVADNDHILEQFTFTYLSVIPVMIIAGCLLGWFLAAHALTPVLEVARAADRITSSNLSLRIPTRGAGDELDYLVDTFNKMIARLEHSFQQIRQFSTDVSHELRTPITAIRGQLEVALFTAKSTEQYREAMLNSLQDVERLSQIVRALLLLSQAESGQLALQKAPLNLSESVADIVDQFQIPAEGAHVRLSKDLPPSCPAEVDRVQFERMVSNLLSNAIKFTPAGGEVRVSLYRYPEAVDLEVADTGCGIPSEHLPHIFDRFYQVSGPGVPAVPERGLGLGLSFVAWIVKAHGGTIEVDSTPGRGTRFTINLPAPSLEEQKTEDRSQKSEENPTALRR